MNKPTILIDYDDTLLPTTFLEENGITMHAKINKNTVVYKKLVELDKEVVKFLNLCYEYGNPLILTNAETAWVLNSCKKYMPNAYKIISKMEIHSAREKYSTKYKHAKDWKKMLLLHDLSHILLKSNFVISIGDSEYERSAVINFCNNNINIKHKNILIDADVTRLESTTLFIKIINTIFKYIAAFQAGIDYIIGLKAYEKKIRSPRKSQHGITPKTV